MKGGKLTWVTDIILNDICMAGHVPLYVSTLFSTKEKSLESWLNTSISMESSTLGNDFGCAQGNKREIAAAAAVITKIGSIS